MSMMSMVPVSTRNNASAFKTELHKTESCCFQFFPIKVEASESTLATPLEFQNDASGRRDTPVGNYCFTGSHDVDMYSFKNYKGFIFKSLHNISSAGWTC